MRFIKYIGNRETHPEQHYGTNLTFVPGQVHPVSDDAAVKMLVHTDTYEEVEKPEGMAKPAEENTADSKAKADKEDQQREEDQRRNEPPLVNLGTMDKDALAQYAQQHFNQKLPKTMKEETMRTRIAALINSRGGK